VVYELKNLERSDLGPYLRFDPEICMEELLKYMKKHRITGLIIKV
jgi:hypothetical protein